MLGVTTQKCADRRPSFCRIGAVRMNDGRVVIAIADAVNRNEMVTWFLLFQPLVIEGGNPAIVYFLNVKYFLCTNLSYA